MPLTNRMGHDCVFVMGVEDGYNTMPGTPVGVKFRHARVHFRQVYDWIASGVQRGDPNPYFGQRGLSRVPGAYITFPMLTGEFGAMCYGLFGDYSVSGGGDPYTHTFEIDETALDSYWIELQYSALTKYDLFNGAVISGISIGQIMKGSGLIMVRVDFMLSGKCTLNGGAPQDASVDVFTGAQHTLGDASIEIDTAEETLLESASFSITRGVYMYGPPDGEEYQNDFDHIKYQYPNCALTGWQDASDTLHGLDDDAEHQVEWISPRAGDATHYVNISVEEAFITRTMDAGEQGADGPEKVQMAIQPHYDNGASASSVVITVLDETADYAALF